MKASKTPQGRGVSASTPASQRPPPAPASPPALASPPASFPALTSPPAQRTPLHREGQWTVGPPPWPWEPRPSGPALPHQGLQGKL